MSAGDNPFFFFFFGLQLTARLKLQFQSGTPLLKSLDLPLESAAAITLCFQLRSAHYTALQMKNSKRSASATTQSPQNTICMPPTINYCIESAAGADPGGFKGFHGTPFLIASLTRDTAVKSRNSNRAVTVVF